MRLLILVLLIVIFQKTVCPTAPLVVFGSWTNENASLALDSVAEFIRKFRQELGFKSLATMDKLGTVFILLSENLGKNWKLDKNLMQKLLEFNLTDAAEKQLAIKKYNRIGASDFRRKIFPPKFILLFNSVSEEFSLHLISPCFYPAHGQNRWLNALFQLCAPKGINFEQVKKTERIPPDPNHNIREAIWIEDLFAGKAFWVCIEKLKDEYIGIGIIPSEVAMQILQYLGLKQFWACLKE